MNFSTSFSNKALIIAIVTLIALSGCAHTGEERHVSSRAGGAEIRVAVLPVDNLSDTPAPLKEMRRALIGKLQALGVQVIDENLLEKSMAKHRFRYVGGVDETMAQAFRNEINADAVFITSLELYNESTPPKFAVTARLVSTDDNPKIEWMESVGVAGDDSPGILGLGLIENPVMLREKALNSIVGSLDRWLAEKKGVCPVPSTARRFRPKELYNASAIKPAVKSTLAVAPFFNESLRKHAGEILQLHFVRQLVCRGNVALLDPGVVREKMLELRIVMHEGVSLRDVDLLTNTLDVDFILSGKVFDYQDYQGGSGTPVIDFSALLLERKDKKVVWASKSYNKGDEGVFFFDVGKLTTANVMAEKMVGTVVQKMAGGK
jgi:TolB-like protein